MDCLEFNIEQAILSDLAANAAKFTDDAEITPIVNAVASKVQTISVVDGVPEDTESRVYMSASRVRCHIGYGELAMSLPHSFLSNIVPVLIDILRDVPRIDFDESLSWEEWSLPDELVSTTVSALLRLSSAHPEYRVAATGAIFKFAREIVTRLEQGTASNVLTQFAPSFHGFYRALISTSFPWSMTEWTQLTLCLNSLLGASTIERLNRLLVDVVQVDGITSERLQFIQTLLSRYVANGRPLTGYFIVCCVTEVQWTVLAQCMIPPAPNSPFPSATADEAEAANHAWQALLQDAVPQDALQLDEKTLEAVNNATQLAMQNFTELLIQIEDMETEPAADTYAWETMSESLKLASVCCVAVQRLDEDLASRLRLLLSAESPIWDMLVQEAALKSTIVLVRNFREIASPMVSHLRRFVTAPLPIFEIEFASETRSPPPLLAAAKCFALCIKIAPGDDLILSNMYSLLNYIAAASKEITDSSTSTHLASIAQYMSTSEHGSTLHSMEAGLRGMSEEEKRLVGISTIAVVTRLALEFKVEEVTRLTISMLLQRLRLAEPSVEAAISNNLVDLALAAPESSFIDIIRAFSAINRFANPDDPRFSNNMVLAAQTRLAKEIHRRPEFAMIYLTELLTLFGDRGVAIQNIAASNQQVKTDDMVEQLASLLLPIDALLNHETFDAATIAGFSSEVVALFRNMWFLCTLFQFTAAEGDGSGSAMQWQKPALLHIAVKSPAIVSEEARESLSGDIEYNSVIRQEYALNAIGKHRTLLSKHIALRAHEIRTLSPGQIVFLLTMHEMENMRSSTGRPSSLVTYFLNESLNQNEALSACMESIAEKVMRGSVADLNMQAAEQMLPEQLSQELRQLLVLSTHRIEKTRDIASKYLNRLIMSFPSLMCDPPLVVAILEVLTMMSRACEDEFTDEFNPVYEFYSDRANITLHLSDSYKVRKDVLAQLQRNSRTWLELALGRAPVELKASLQKYLALGQPTSLTDVADLGASMAEEFGKAFGPGERQLTSLASLTSFKPDHAKTHVSQMVAKAYFLGEAAGIRALSGTDPDTVVVSAGEVEDLRARMQDAFRGIEDKSTHLVFKDLRRLLFRCAALLISKAQTDYGLVHYLVALPFAVFTPSAISAGIDAWTWLIAEKPTSEITLMGEICASWDSSISHDRGLFSKTMNFDDPFYNDLQYSPTSKENIDRQANAARRLLTPHGLILQMLLSRLQAARYRKPGLMRLIQRLILRSARNYQKLSTHALAREARFSFLLFGFELLRGMHLDVYCEHLLREALYTAAFSWFAVRPQWSFGSSRIQVDADLKVLSEFLSSLQNDTIRGYSPITSLTNLQSSSRTPEYVSRLKSINLLLRFLVEDEISRLAVWSNPMHDAKRGTDHLSTTERTMTDAMWTTAARTAWQINPAIAIHLTERTRNLSVLNEVGRLVRSASRDVLEVPEAVRFLLGDSPSKRDLKHLLIWAPVTPVVAVTYFQQDDQDPLLLQYAHRVLEQHPVALTFFFVPQIVQALRYDKLGYVARFIFEQAKISQLFCHQIVWNMKANCYKDDLGEIEDPMKPMLDLTTARIVEELSGEAKDFYEREFAFFGEVTDISGKLRPFIRKTKPEKKAKIDEEMAKIKVEVGVYLPSNPDGKVIDIDRKSGRPLQSHAKAPFMATFRVRKQRIVVEEDPEALVENVGAKAAFTEYDAWLQAIFKVGDDCRQDVLALQIIAMFKGIFESVGLTLYLFPYRVTATAPGCGVIDVVPNATSRDEMGRAKVNDLLGFFRSRYGGEDTVAFQQARLNFIQSMAAYSVACYILQIKDRHNGNIMIDGEGHIVHIDFGFLFDIGPGGVKFEPSSFKLTHEMVVLMGGRYSQGYALFQQLTVRAFLALRPHTDALVSTVELMLDTGLPSFKGPGTIKRLRDRFAPGIGERQAAEWMVGVIRNAHENVRSTAYDEFQRLQNGIPYK